ncbi:MAG: tRNA dihydrouridine synthase DusB [Oscillospiraceae bacterium]|nr:tRNA dihydrouridine synthase DusB [Oscillospiraceae bacterium]
MSSRNKNPDMFRNFRVMLAPMAGFSDSSFRAVCRSLGADATVSEMISVKALRLGDKKSPLLMKFTEAERPFGIQLFGADPDDIAYGAGYAEKNFSPDFIDINMGCPAPKITGSGAGSKLMTDPVLSGEIVAAAVSAVSVPVTCKIRAGYHETSADSFSVILEQNGASCIFVHGRTRDRMYSPPVDLDIIKKVKEAVSIPVLGNGDITSAQDAVQMISKTSCDGVMVGRGCLGDPFLFGRIKAALNGLPVPDEPSLEEKMDTLIRQARAAVEEKGESLAMREMRKQAVYYFRGINGAAALRADCVKLETLDDLAYLCKRALALRSFYGKT